LNLINDLRHKRLILNIETENKVILLHLVRIWPNIKVCSKFIEIYYNMWYLYGLILIVHNKRLGGDSPTLKRTSFSYALNILYVWSSQKKPWRFANPN